MGDLFKACGRLHCDKLTLIMMHGEKREIVEKGKTVRCVLAADCLKQE